MVYEPSPFWVATGPRGFPDPPVTEPIKASLLVNVIEKKEKFLLPNFNTNCGHRVHIVSRIVYLWTR